MRKILEYSKGSKTLYVLAPLFKMFEACLELIVPLVVASMIDNGIASDNRQFIIKLSIQLVILAVVGFSFSVTAQYFAAKAATVTVKKAKQALFDKVQSLSFSQLDSTGGATLITRLTSDMDSVQNGINLTLRLLLRSPFVVAGACIMAFRVDPGSALVFAGVVPLLCIVIFAIMFITIPMYTKVRAHLDKVLISVRESITGARVIRAFCKEEETEKEFINLNSVLTRFQVFTGRFSALMNPVTQLIVNAGIAVLIYVGAIRVSSGLITAGTVVALYNYMSQILVELVKFANLIITISKSIACAERVEKIFLIQDEEKPAVTDEKSDNYIEFRNVTFTYTEGAQPSLDNVSFTVSKGDKIGIVGSTGSGKTTLINMLSGFYKPTCGEIFIDGKNILLYDKNELGSLISVAEQKPCIFKGTVRSNLSLGKQNASVNEIDNALIQAQAYDFVCEKDGIESVCEQNGRNFSGGQKQRLSIARALVKNSPILVLDDSFSALDYATEAALRKEIDKTNSTKFIISQRTGSILECDKIIVLEDGKAQVGTHDELLKTSDTYREIHLSQFEQEVDAV